jgi:hypothetical protein
MKKWNKLIGITALAFALAFISCASMVIVDKTLSPEQTATVRFANGTIIITHTDHITVARYNGMPVKKWRIVKIPEGDAQFVVNLRQETTSYSYRLYNAAFGYHFEGGKEYTLVSNRSNYGDWIIEIYSGNHSEAGTLPLPKENLLDTIAIEADQPKRAVMTAESE